MQIVIIESPFSGRVKRNVKYLKRALKDSLLKGEAPFASHALYTQVLDDTNPNERKLGMSAGFAYIPISDYTVVYGDYGISHGMEEGIAKARKMKHPVYYRYIGKN